MEVRREDQEKINKFSSLHQKETTLEEELSAKIVRTPRLNILGAFKDYHHSLVTTVPQPSTSVAITTTRMSPRMAFVERY